MRKETQEREGLRLEGVSDRTPRRGRVFREWHPREDEFQAWPWVAQCDCGLSLPEDDQGRAMDTIRMHLSAAHGVQDRINDTISRVRMAMDHGVIAPVVHRHSPRPDTGGI